MQQRLRLLRRVQLEPVLVAQPLRPGAERQQPVAAHLQIVVQGLHRLVIEAVAAGALARRPDQRLVRVGEAAAAEIRHRVRLAPDDVVEQPEAEILQRRADAENVVVAADHPERAVLPQQPAALGEPLAGEGVVGGEVGEAVPLVVDAVDEAVIGPAQLAAELEVVRRVGEDAVDRRAGQHPHHADAVAAQDLVERQVVDGVQLRACSGGGARLAGGRAPRQPGGKARSSSCSRTGAKPARWWRVAPSRARAARCSAVP